MSLAGFWIIVSCADNAPGLMRRKIAGHRKRQLAIRRIRYGR
jgi:hypothetical protein